MPHFPHPSPLRSPSPVDNPGRETALGSYRPRGVSGNGWWFHKVEVLGMRGWAGVWTYYSRYV
jgi:hypothetical protein